MAVCHVQFTLLFIHILLSTSYYIFRRLHIGAWGYMLPSRWVHMKNNICLPWPWTMPSPSISTAIYACKLVTFTSHETASSNTITFSGTAAVSRENTSKCMYHIYFKEVSKETVPCQVNHFTSRPPRDTRLTYQSLERVLLNIDQIVMLKTSTRLTLQTYYRSIK